MNIRCPHAAKIKNCLDVPFAPRTMLRHAPAVNLINPIHQLPDSVLVRAVCPDKPRHGASIPLVTVESRSDDPKDELGTDKRQRVVPDVRSVTYMAGLHLRRLSVQMVAVEEDQGACGSSLRYGNVLRLAVSFGLDCEVGTGYPVPHKCTVLDLGAVLRIETP